MSDKIIKSFLHDDFFRKNKNPHKYAVLYASKFYMVINNALRNFDANDETRCICCVYLRFLDYFQNYGVSKKTLLKKGSTLFRGYPYDFQVHTHLQDSSFISTTFDRDVANKFASYGKGTIIEIKVKELPSDIPYVVIADESEVVFPPGIITTSGTKAKYTCPPIKNKCLSTIQKGGMDEPFEIPKIDLRNKIVVWYRAIQERKVDILGFRVLPKTHKAVIRDFIDVVKPKDDMLQAARSFIPDFTDLQEIKDKTSEQKARMRSYTVHMAILNPKSKHVETINYGIFDSLFPNFFDVSRSQEVIATIMEHFTR